MFRKAQNTSVIANLSKHRFLFKLFICFSPNAHFKANKPKNLCTAFAQGFI
jgi:hypothetical protein